MLPSHAQTSRWDPYGHPAFHLSARDNPIPRAHGGICKGAADAFETKYESKETWQHPARDLGRRIEPDGKIRDKFLAKDQILPRPDSGREWHLRTLGPGARQFVPLGLIGAASLSSTGRLEEVRIEYQGLAPNDSFRHELSAAFDGHCNILWSRMTIYDS